MSSTFVGERHGYHVAAKVVDHHEAVPRFGRLEGVGNSTFTRLCVKLAISTSSSPVRFVGGRIRGLRQEDRNVRQAVLRRCGGLGQFKHGSAQMCWSVPPRTPQTPGSADYSAAALRCGCFNLARTGDSGSHKPRHSKADDRCHQPPSLFCRCLTFYIRTTITQKERIIFLEIYSIQGCI